MEVKQDWQTKSESMIELEFNYFPKKSPFAFYSEDDSTIQKKQ